MRILMALLLALGGILAGCRSTRSESAPADYRQDQATRQTQREKSDPPAARRPLERGGTQGQDVIDQPR